MRFNNQITNIQNRLSLIKRPFFFFILCGFRFIPKSLVGLNVRSYWETFIWCDWEMFLQKLRCRKINKTDDTIISFVRIIIQLNGFSGFEAISSFSSINPNFGNQTDLSESDREVNEKKKHTKNCTPTAFL